MRQILQISAWRRVNVLLVIFHATFFFSCDVLESDPDVIRPDTKVDAADLVVLANSPAFIDLNSKVKTNVPVRIAITSDVQYGQMTDFGKGLIQYTPRVGRKSALDRFEFTVFSQNNEVIARDTMIIRIESDTTNLPCSIYTMADYVYGVTAQSDSILIDVKNNDVICGGSVSLSIYKPGNLFPPLMGSAEVVGNLIRYTPSRNFNGGDVIIYRLSAAADTSRHAYGIVLISGDSLCDFNLKNDVYTLPETAADSLVLLQVLANDSLCSGVDGYQITLKNLPRLGTASVVQGGIQYKVPSSISLPYADDFIYEVCKDASCKDAKVEIFIKTDSASCRLIARPDSVSLAADTATVVLIHALRNDSICGTINRMKIIRMPSYGKAVVDNKVIAYHIDPLHRKDDLLEYEICNDKECSRATITIKRKN